MALVFRLAALSLSSLCAAQQEAFFPPNDERILYSDYACAHVGPELAAFDRNLAVSWVCHQEQMSPGVRASFLADASHVRLELDYSYAGFFCGTEPPTRLSWEFGLVVDGVRRQTGPGNPLYPLIQGSTPWIPLGLSPGPHKVTLIWPGGADVALRGLHLKESRDQSTPSLLAPEVRSQPLVAIYGDSITHGLNASHILNTYPVRLGALMDWKVINLGFAGRNTQPSDALLAAGISTCKNGLLAPPPDVLIMAIGSNDYHLIFGIHTRLGTFEQRYRQWLDLFRSFRPTTPILCLTPLPRGDECRIKNRMLEQYRQGIRDVVAQYADPHIYLFEGRDLISMPPMPGDPLYDADGLHLNDAGSQQVAARLTRFNLIRNAGFELHPFVACEEVPEPEPYLWTDVGPGLSVVTTDVGGNRILSLSSSGSRAQEVYGLSEGKAFTFKIAGRTTTGGGAGSVALEFLDASDIPIGSALVLQFNQDNWRRVTRHGAAPAGAVRGRLTLSKESGGGRFLVDELELTVDQL